MSHLGETHEFEPDFLLLQEYANTRSEDAAARLLRLHEETIFRTCKRFLRDAHLAEDATQGVFLLLLTKGPVCADRSLQPWLRRASRLVCANVARSTRIAQRHERTAALTRAESQSAGAPSPVAAHLAEVVDGIGECDRMLLERRYLRGRTTRELAGEMGISAQAVRKRLSRALGRARVMALQIEAATNEKD